MDIIAVLVITIAIGAPLALIIALTQRPALGGPIDRVPGRMKSSDIRSAALEIVWPLPQCSESWIGGTVEECDRAQMRLDERRREYINFEPPWMRAAIMDWFDFAETKIRKTRKDCLTQKSRKRLDEFGREQAEKSSRVRDILHSIKRVE